MLNFIEACLQEKAAPEDIDDFIEYWHTHDTGDSLIHFLGMNHFEFEEYLKHGGTNIEDILRNRRQDKSAWRKNIRVKPVKCVPNQKHAIDQKTKALCEVFFDITEEADCLLRAGKNY